MAELIDTDKSDEEKRPQFGNRLLTDTRNVFEHNAWDNVVWNDEQEQEARQITQQQLQCPMPEHDQEKRESDAREYWNTFYGIHQNRFFKDRHWLFTEFPELLPESGCSGDGSIQAASSKHDAASTHTSDCHINSTNQGTGDALGDNIGKQSSVNSNKENDVQETCENVPNASGYTTDHSSGSLNRALGAVSIGNTGDIKVNLTRCTVPAHSNTDKTTVTNELRESSEANAGDVGSVGDGDINKDQVAEAVGEKYPGESATFRILEVGCGVGNTVFPILLTNNDPGLMVYCCDFSSTAVNLVKHGGSFVVGNSVDPDETVRMRRLIRIYTGRKTHFSSHSHIYTLEGRFTATENPDYNRRRCCAFVCDISDENATVPVPDASLDVIILIFVLSAVHPSKMQAVINRLARLLKPGGVILFRDYGRYDMAQLRFKKGRCLSENFYARGDGTRVYFFTQDELRDMMTTAGMVEKQNLIDRRLQVNRGKQLKMYRVWIQCKYTKHLHTGE